VNKNKIFLFLINTILCYCFKIYGQNPTLPSLDTSALRVWPNLIDGSGIISSDGSYVGYSISKSPLTIHIPYKTIFKSLKSNWEVQIVDLIRPAIFTDDSKLGLVLLKENRLFIQQLGNNMHEIIPDIIDFNLVTGGGKQYLIYLKETTRELTVRNLANKIERKYNNVYAYKFSGNSFYLVVKKNFTYSIDKYELNSEIKNHIWDGIVEPSSLIVTDDAKRICFKVGEILYYCNIDNKAELIKLKSPEEGRDAKTRILEPFKFSLDGNLLFVQIKEPSLAPLNPNVNPVQIFSYQDGTFDINLKKEQPCYWAVYDINNNSFVRLEDDNERFNFRSITSSENLALVTHREGELMEYYWNQKGWNNDYVINIINGEKKLIGKRMGDLELSPNGKYVIFQQNWRGDFKCMDVQTGQINKLTENLPIPKKDSADLDPMTENGRGLHFGGWVKDLQAVIIYDRYDIWMLDMGGNRPPVCLTNSYGRKHHIVFRICQFEDNNRRYLIGNQKVILSAFSENNKDNGFYLLNSNPSKDPILLSMGRFVYVAPDQNVNSISPVKAKNKNLWLVWRMSGREAPNYYWTENFKKFNNISNLHPQGLYQWHTAELISFNTKDGISTQAILYKPDDFDSTKKYPVLFSYYEKESDKLNAFQIPNITNNYCFNYPMMLSRGYLICLTDIHFKTGNTAHSIVDAVEGAATYLSKFSFIDSSRYGVCGGSLGGYESNCLATFSHKFAAAVSISGPSDLISAYGNVPGLRDEEYENRQFRMGVSLSTNPMQYLQNSPVAYTKNVTTPVLIVNTTLDRNVNVQQGMEFFISLRREGKISWLLRYQHEGHGIRDLGDQYDLFMRMNQFYDHYLMGAPAPIWMTKGISVNETGVHSGFDYDRNQQSPLPSSLLMFNK